MKTHTKKSGTVGLLLCFSFILQTLTFNLVFGDPPATTYYPFNGAASATVSSGTTMVLSRLGGVSTEALALGSGTGAYVAQLVLSDTGAHTGDLYFVPVSYPASTNPTLQVFDSSTGSLLHSSTGTGIAGNTVLRFVNVAGTAWTYTPEGAVLGRNLGAGVQGALGQAPNSTGGFLTGTGGSLGSAAYQASSAYEAAFTPGAGLTLNSGTLSVTVSGSDSRLSGTGTLTIPGAGGTALVTTSQLSASNVTTGNLTIGDLTFTGAFPVAQIPSLPGSILTSGTVTIPVLGSQVVGAVANATNATTASSATTATTATTATAATTATTANTSGALASASGTASLTVSPGPALTATDTVSGQAWTTGTNPPWTMIRSNTLFYNDGTSWDYGPVSSGTVPIASGGVAGNYGYLVAQYFGVTEWNDSIPGTSSSNCLARFSTGSTTDGVTVPSALSYSGSAIPKVAFLGMSGASFNDAGQGFSLATSTNNIIAWTGSFHAAGYYVVGVVCASVSSAASPQAAGQFNSIISTATNHLGCDMIVDCPEWVADQTNTTLYPDGIHPSAICNRIIADHIITAMTAHGSLENDSYGVYQFGLQNVCSTTILYWGPQTSPFNATAYNILSFNGINSGPGYGGVGVGASTNANSSLDIYTVSGDVIRLDPNGEMEAAATVIVSGSGTLTTGTAGFTGNVSIGGTATGMVTLSGTTGSTGPSNTTTPVLWEKVLTNGTASWVPVYQ